MSYKGVWITLDMSRLSSEKAFVPAAQIQIPKLGKELESLQKFKDSIQENLKNCLSMQATPAAAKSSALRSTVQKPAHPPAHHHPAWTSESSFLDERNKLCVKVLPRTS